MAVQLRVVPGGVLVPVRLQPRAARNELGGERGGALSVRLTAPPIEGEANRACVRFLAEVLGVAPRRVSIVSGHRSRDKLLRVEGLDLDAVRQALGLRE